MFNGGGGGVIKCYIVAEIEVHDSAGFESYRAAVAPMISDAGGRYVVRGGAVRQLEGDAPNRRMVIIEFPSLKMAETFWNSEEYRAVAALRHNSSHSRIYMIEGLPS